jgi:hypothetical protein
MYKLRLKVCVVLVMLAGLLCGCLDFQGNNEDNGDIDPDRYLIVRSIASEYGIDDNSDADSHSLVGFWHSAPDFAGGYKELYRFFVYGEGFEYESTDGKLHYGYWDVTSNNILELTFSEPERKVSYAIEQEADGTVALINGKKFWKLREPVDIINGIPLYVYILPQVEKDDISSEVIYVSNPYMFHKIAVLSYDGDLYDFKIVVISYDFGDDSISYYYKQEDIIFELEHLSPDFVVNFENADIGTAYMEAFTFCDASGNNYTYGMPHGGRATWTSHVRKLVLAPELL